MDQKKPPKKRKGYRPGMEHPGHKRFLRSLGELPAPAQGVKTAVKVVKNPQK